MDLVDESLAGDIKSTEELLKNGTDPNIVLENKYYPKDNLGNEATTPVISNFFILELFYDRNMIEMIELFLKYDANPNIHTHDNKTLLYKAVQDDNFEMVKLLLKYGANPTFYYTFRDPENDISWAMPEKFLPTRTALDIANENTEMYNLLKIYTDIWKSDSKLKKIDGDKLLSLKATDELVTIEIIDDKSTTTLKGLKDKLIQESEYFEAFFSERWEGDNKNTYRIKGVSWAYPKASLAIMKFIEMGKIGKVDPQVALDILPAGSYYQLNNSDSFYKQVSKALLKNLQDEGVEEYIKDSIPSNHWMNEMF